MDNCREIPLRRRIPESTIKGNRDGIICLYQVVRPVFTREMLLTGLVRRRNINNSPVNNGKYFVYKADIFAEYFLVAH